jgi:UDP-N-acetyl-D-galactosamine dehydrogenase
MKLSDLKLAIVGLGYVGLPLAVEFAKKRLVVGFDIKKTRIKELKLGIDKTLEVSRSELLKAKRLILTHSKKDLKLANCFIIAVPTPIDKKNNPDLKLLIKASEIIGKFLKKGDIVIYESTVYPGCTEEKCVPILEKFSGLKYNKNFFCGYSPERINPGDKKHRISNVVKITSGSTEKITDLIDSLYNQIVKAGTHKVSSIKIAEAAKVIENTQRDLNIAFMNELYVLFSKMNINTEEVLNAAGTKWNFLPFRPGLVGGHCIGVDPYYLTYKAKKVGYEPKIILAGRSLNDSMGFYVADQLVKLMKNKSIQVRGSRILVMGLTFKENCPDLRNSGVANVILNLKKYKCKLDLYDPWVSNNEINNFYDFAAITNLLPNTYDGIIIAVAHNKFKKLGYKFISTLGKKSHVLYDLKYIFSKEKSSL